MPAPPSPHLPCILLLWRKHADETYHARPVEAPVINIAEGATFNGGIKMEPRASEASVMPGRPRDASPPRTGTAN